MLVQPSPPLSYASSFSSSQIMSAHRSSKPCRNGDPQNFTGSKLLDPILMAIFHFRSKKVPSSNSPPAKRRSVATSHSTSGQVSSRRPKTEPRRFSPANDDSPAPPPSMVQQLADVAQSARELLGMEEEDETELTKEQEEEEPSNSECSREIDTARLDPLGQLLLLRLEKMRINEDKAFIIFSSQMQNSPAMGAEQASTMLDSAVAGMVKMEKCEWNTQNCTKLFRFLVDLPLLISPNC
jgi:hypothetical protein